MSLTILIRGHQKSIDVLADVCFTQANFGNNTNTTLSVNTPRGVLGGSVAAISTVGGDYTAVAGNLINMPTGLFMNDAAGAAFENSPAVASGKLAIIKAMASVEVDVYETRNAANSADLVYSQGDKLYSSVWGFLTNEASTSAVVVGICTKAPSVASPTLGLDMRL